MSLHPTLAGPVPEQTARIARAAFPNGNPCLKWRDELGTLYRDEDFACLFPPRGQPGLPPWRLALVTVLQFWENLTDRQAAEAVRARLDWKYLLGLELSDPGFDFSVLSEFRARLLAGGQEARLLDKLIDRCRELKLLKVRGQQRTDATHVLAAIRGLNRLELVAETLRAALNQLATVTPAWLKTLVPEAWYERYSRRIEDSRLPKREAEREAYARQVGEDGFALLDAVAATPAALGLHTLPAIKTLRQLWQRHYARSPTAADNEPRNVQFKSSHELSRTAEGIASPYDPEARYRRKRETCWTGYTVHLTETCDTDAIHLITQVTTTSASVHEALCTAAIQQALAKRNLAPGEHFADAGYVHADVLISSAHDHGITLIGPPRLNPSWQAKAAGGYELDRFEIDWNRRRVRCPQGQFSSTWNERTDSTGHPSIAVRFRQVDCHPCSARSSCTRSRAQIRQLKLPPRQHHEALQAARQRLNSETGKKLYARRAGIEGTLSQGVRGFGLRRTRYRGLAKTHLQHLATAVAINLDRLFAWLEGIPHATTRTSRFASLAA